MQILCNTYTNSDFHKSQLRANYADGTIRLKLIYTNTNMHFYQFKLNFLPIFKVKDLMSSYYTLTYILKEISKHQ